MVLYSLTRHSAHHEKGSKPYWSLPAYTEAPESIRTLANAARRLACATTR